MENIDSWTDVLVHPLGMAGFALFLVFIVLTRFRKGKSNKLFTTAFVIMAFVSLMGGFMLAYHEQHSNGSHDLTKTKTTDSEKNTSTESKKPDNPDQ